MSQVEIRLTGEDKVQRHLLSIAGMWPAIRTTLERELIALQAHVVADKLTGQVLHVRSGTLGRSITYRLTDSLHTLLGTVGTNVRYARIHEYGGVIHLPAMVPRRARALRFEIGNAVVFAMRVRAHDVTMPERSFLRSALDDRKPDILRALAGTIRDQVAA